MEKKNLKIFYHNDADGIMSAAVVNYYLYTKQPEIYKNTLYFPIDYNYRTSPLSFINKDEEIIIVDFSFKPNVMLDILELTDNVIWIDHHKTAIELYQDFPVKIRGMRSTKRSAAFLTWNYLFPKIADSNVPQAIKLVDDYDRWVFNYEHSDEFRLGMLLMSGESPENITFWKKLLEEEDSMFIQKVVDVGEVILNWQDMGRRKADPYKASLGGYTFLVMNLKGNSKAFDYCDKGETDGLMLWHFDGKLYNYSLYHSKKGRIDRVDFTKLASAYGGGGHPGACGFSTDTYIL
jgi:uncharacterized protein